MVDKDYAGRKDVYNVDKEKAMFDLSPVIENAAYLLSQSYRPKVVGSSTGNSSSSSHSSNSSSASASRAAPSYVGSSTGNSSSSSHSSNSSSASASRAKGIEDKLK